MLFVVEGELSLTLQGQVHAMQPGGYAFIPPGADYKVRNTTGQHTRFHWIRKHYQKVDGVPLPEAFVTNEQDIQPLVMPDTEPLEHHPLRRRQATCATTCTSTSSASSRAA